MREYPIIETVGVEIETTSIFRSEPFLTGDLRNYFRISDDASIKTDALEIGQNHTLEIGSNVPRILKSFRIVTKGIEFITIPISDKEVLKKAIDELLERLTLLGEPERGIRNGIHIHIGFTHNLDILKNIIINSLKYEALFFRLGGMGYTFRGIENDSIYCRPFSEEGPPCIYHRDHVFPIISINKLLQTKSSEEFWKFFCGASEGLGRYHPIRYFFVNPFSLLLHGTLEFRVFNFTLNSRYLLAMVELCQEFCRKCLQGTEKLVQINSAFSAISNSELHKQLEEFNLESYANNVLHTIIDITPQTILNNGYVYTHLRNFRVPGKSTLATTTGLKAIDPEKVRIPNNIDIHILRGEVERPQEARRDNFREFAARIANINNDPIVLEEGPDIDEEFVEENPDAEGNP